MTIEVKASYNLYFSDKIKEVYYKNDVLVVKDNVKINDIYIVKCFTHSRVRQKANVYEIVLAGDYLCDNNSIIIDTNYLVLNKEGKKKYNYYNIEKGVSFIVNKDIKLDDIELEDYLLNITRTVIFIIVIIVILLYRRLENEKT